MSDAELIALLRTQPEQGCKALLEQYTGLVLAICRRRLGGICTAEDIEELAGDILFAFWQKRDRLSEKKGSVRALLVTMADRRCIDWYRRTAGRRAVQTVPIDEMTEELPDGIQTPEEQVIGGERKKEIIRALHQLDPQEADLILRKYYRGETASEIAASLGLRTGTVEMRLSRIRAKLRGLLGGEHDDG
ncbi:MAG: sigma-70 family RNA polymerase sigma factor [Oscillospiraceae bacterium]|nr:sigma-70 family RNA polymerase sigma factor [Oscillospiraceae bacterium]